MSAATKKLKRAPDPIPLCAAKRHFRLRASGWNHQLQLRPLWRMRRAKPAPLRPYLFPCRRQLAVVVQSAGLVLAVVLCRGQAASAMRRCPWLEGAWLDKSTPVQSVLETVVETPDRRRWCVASREQIPDPGLPESTLSCTVSLSRIGSQSDFAPHMFQCRPSRLGGPQTKFGFYRRAPHLITQHTFDSTLYCWRSQIFETGPDRSDRPARSGPDLQPPDRRGQRRVAGRGHAKRRSAPPQPLGL